MRIDSRTTLACYLLLALAYAGGLAVPLMNNDSGHHAGIALNMYLSGDWLSLVTQGRDYLDKPHLLFWLAALSFKLFGVTTFAYKLPSLLFSLLAIYSTVRLGRLLYSAEAGRLAGLVLASALAFILANNDVRMDAILTGAIIFSIWQLAEFAAAGRWRNLLLGGLGLALGFSTKGMIGVAMPCIAVFLHLAWRRDWARLFDWRWLALLPCFLLFAAPVLYAYYHQFGAGGVKFILWSQNFERLAGERFGNAGADDKLFFVHTFLWAFLPWSLLALAAVWAHLRAAAGALRQPRPGVEMLTLGTLLVIFTIISLSRFKLPHYLNILLPLFSVMLGAWLAARPVERAGRAAWAAQLVVVLLLAVLALALNGWAFPVSGMLAPALAAFALLAGAVLVLRSQGSVRLLLCSLTAAVAFNVLLNFNFYPQLLRYQAGNMLAAQLERLGVAADDVVYLEGEARANSFDFYTARLTPALSVDDVAARPGATIVYTGESGLDALEAAGLKTEALAVTPDFRVTRLNSRFLSPLTREQGLQFHYLLRVEAR